jgi:hypothetical protein
MRTLLQTIDQYDYEQRTHIDWLEDENARLRAKNAELVAQLASYVATVDRMKFELIMAGALTRPTTQQPKLPGEDDSPATLDDAKVSP